MGELEVLSELGELGELEACLVFEGTTTFLKLLDENIPRALSVDAADTRADRE